jgi:histidinol-phosphatase (PHP family)
VLTDYHLHLSPDGPEARAAAAGSWEQAGGLLSPGWIGRYAERAGARAISELALTEHVHRFREAREWTDNAWWRAESELPVDAYCDAVLDAREGHGLPVLVHWLGELAVDHPDYPAWDRLPAERVWAAYLGELRAAADSGLFDVLAHPDLPKVFGHPLPEALADDMAETVAAIAASGVAIECSSAGLRKPVGELYPDPDLLAAFRSAGVPVTLSSDAHVPGDVGRDYPTAVAALRGAGYETLTRFAARVPSQEPIG